MRFPRLPADDELAIRNLFARYGHLADAGAPAFIDLFTEDATWTRENSAPASMGRSGLPRETISRAAPGALMTEVMQKKIRQRMHHQFADFHVEPGGTADAAQGHARALITDWRDGPGKFSMIGKYTLEFARTASDWRIRSASV